MMGLLSGITLNRAVEKPPKQYASGPAQRVTTELRLESPQAVQKFCGLFSGLKHAERMGDPYTMACFVPDIGGTGQGVVVLPSDKAWPSKREIEDLRKHEWGHARGWRHNVDGRGTSPDSLPPRKP